MSWDRLIQSGFESGTINEGNFFAGAFSSAVDVDSSVSGFFNAQGRGLDTVLGHWEVVEGNRQQMRAGFLCRPNGNFFQDVKLFEWFCKEDDGVALYRIVASSDHTWKLLYRDPTDGSIVVLTTETLYRSGFSHADCLVAFGATISIAADPHVSFYINSERILTYSGVHLDDAVSVKGFSIHRGLVFDGNSTFTDFDDIYADVSTGIEADYSPPTLRFPFKRPTADGSSSDWSSSTGGDHFELLNDYPPVDTDYTFVLGAGVTDLFITNPAWTLDDYHLINAVIVMARAKKGNAHLDSALQLVIYDPFSTNEDTSFEELLGAGFEYMFGRFVSDPNGNPWIEAMAQLVECGYRSAGTL